MYSINVFITFSLSQLGMCLHWLKARAPHRGKKFTVNLLGLLMSVSILAVTVTINSESIANWEADDDQWTVPINITVSKLSSFGVFPASYQAGVGAYVAGSDNGPTWQLRAAVVILLPRRR
jgi:hypothetical protein